MAKATNQRAALTKKMVQEGLLRLLANQDIRTITVSDLARESGINRTTFYRHYGTPYDVLKELEEDLISVLSTDDDVIGKMMSGNTVELRRSIERICSHIQEHKETARLIIKNDTDPQFAANLFRFPRNQKLVEKTLPSRLNDEQRALASTFFATGSYCLLRQWIMDELEMTPTQVAGLLTMCIQRGMEGLR